MLSQEIDTVSLSLPTLTDVARPWLLADYLRLVQRRLKQEWQQIEAGHHARSVRLDSQFHQTYQSIEQDYQQRIAQLQAQYLAEQEAANEERRRQESVAARRRASRLAEAERDFEQRKERAEQDRQNHLYQLRDAAQQRLAQLQAAEQVWQADWNAAHEQLQLLVQHAQRVVQRWRVPADAVDITHTIAELEEPISWHTVERALTDARQKLLCIQAHPTARFLMEHWDVLAGLFAALAAIAPTGIYFGWGSLLWLSLVLTTGLVGWFLSRQIVKRLAYRMALRQLPALRADLARARNSLSWLQREYHRAMEEQRARQAERLAEEEQRCQQAYVAIEQEIQRRYAANRTEALQQYTESLGEAQNKWKTTVARLQETYPRQIELLQKECQARLAELQEQYTQQRQEAHIRRQQALDDLRQQWRQIRHQLHSQIQNLVAATSAHRLDWEEMVTEAWGTEMSPATVVPFGYISARWAVDMDLPFVDASERDDILSLPALLTIPDCPSLVVEYADGGRQEAVQLLQTVMLRWMAAMPPGKLRFTLIDPWGLGQNFAAFMHLSDYDEKLIGYRVWTDPDHIRQRLQDLTEHVEMVIQKYLRNEYRSIHEYNAQAGEMAEPIHVVVVAGFPEGFGEEAARKLTSLASSGPTCGVFLLVAVDLRMRLPREFFLTELEANAAVLCWDGTGFVWKHPQLREWKLHTDSPPPPSLMNEIIHRWGKLSLGAARVEVPFRAVAPENGQWWQKDSRGGVEVPVGRAGAARLQFVSLGEGTSQHVVVAGKTGSGKSTFFHVLITNTALYYSPNEIAFYLIDFKKGVEFKVYADQQLPHAEVIAIESEREFGLSVLQRLDDELQRRGEMFRAAGVQDITGYRNLRPHESLPRILVIVDEFQEFFVKEDAIARDASLLLDRLVRQGRAFGVHVILGSQTLAGAYSLARSTLSQMAVRVALQCSETDAHLILSEDNTAARLLSRPGEAIYNDTNGLVEGNHPFQVAWLPVQERVDVLRRLQRFSSEKNVPRRRPIVFEGNRPALLTETPEFIAALQGHRVAEPTTAWLGAAIAIRPPTSVCFRPQPGQHLLLVGQDRTLLLGLLSSLVTSLSVNSQSINNRLRFDVLCSSLDEKELWREGTQVLSQLELHDVANVPSVVQRWSDELSCRRNEHAVQEPWFLILDALNHYPVLRRSESDFGVTSFSSTGNGESVVQQFHDILIEGPMHSMHLVVVCDSYHSFTRWWERSWLREFQYRVLLQMNPTDSSHFIDSPAAHQLGPYRALLYRDDRGEIERFRPFGLPPAWKALSVRQSEMT